MYLHLPYPPLDTMIDPSTKETEHMYSNIGNVLFNPNPSTGGGDTKHYEDVPTMFDPKQSKPYERVADQVYG